MTITQIHRLNSIAIAFKKYIYFIFKWNILLDHESEVIYQIDYRKKPV